MSFALLKLKDFQKKIGNKETALFFLKNNNGMACAITNYGARIVNLSIPTETKGNIEVIAGFDTLAGYLNSSDKYYGAVICRFNNRIKGTKFSLSGREHIFAKNKSPNLLQRKFCGFNNSVWNVLQIADNILELCHISPDHEKNYLSKLTLKVTYVLTLDNSLKISYETSTHDTSFLNLTNHIYFNLNGIGSGSVSRHRLNIRADYYIPVDSEKLPVVVRKSVCQTPFDFRKSFTIGSRINDHSEQLRLCNGYDHVYVLCKHSFKTHVTSVIGDLSGLKMEVFTDQPGLRFHTANDLRDNNLLRGGKPHKFRHYFALQTERLPDANNQSLFFSGAQSLSTILKSEIVYKFS